MREIIGLCYESYNRAKPSIQGGRDRDIRHPEWTRRILDAFGSPDKVRPNVAVTGSKGKGSHAILLAAMLEQCGLRVGLFTGPHLVDFMERFRVNGLPIPEPDFARLMVKVHEVAGSLPVPEGQYIGPVGLLSVVAALWFAEQQTDVNVYECGRGALHDDVNQVVHQGAVVAPVFLEHARELGPTLADIAAEKAGIVTADTRFVVSHTQTAVVEQVFERACAAHGAALTVLGRDFVDPGSHPHLAEHPPGAVPVRLPPGSPSYLHSNAAVAATAAQRVLDVLCERAAAGSGQVPPVRLPRAFNLDNLLLPGRMQVVREAPLTVVDGTIHRSSARYVELYLQDWRSRAPAGAQVGLVLGIPADKDGAGLVAVLAPHVSFAVVTKAQNPHLSFDDQLLRVAQEYLQDATKSPELAAAVGIADGRLEAGDLLLILGTQSLVGEALQHFRAPTQAIWRPVPAGGMPV